MTNDLGELRRRRQEAAAQLNAYKAGNAPYWIGPNGPTQMSPEYATGLEASIAELDVEIAEIEASNA